VIAILLALLVPVLGSVRRAALETQSLSNVRQLAAVIGTYTSSEGEYPAFEEGVFYPSFRPDAQFSFPYWQASSHWTGVVYGLLPYDANERVYVSPGSDRLASPGDAFPSSYQYSSSFIAQPRVWDGSGLVDDGLKRPVRPDQVRFASGKVLLWDIEMGWRSDRPFNEAFDLVVETALGFADGSGRMGTPSEATAAVENPFPDASNSLKRMRLHNTADGVGGRDY